MSESASDDRPSSATDGAAHPSGVEADGVARCANCGARLAGRYCAECGQDSREANVSMRTWLAENVEEVLSFDSRIVRTLKLLFARPGAATVEWAQGRRSRWVRPLRLYLLAAFVFFSSAALFERGESGILGDVLAGAFEETGDHEHATPRTDEELDAFVARLEAYLPRVVLLLVPLSALLLRLIYRRARLHYIVHLVFALHFHAVFFLLRACIMPLPERADDVGELVLAVAVLVYLVLATRRVYAQSAGAAVVKSVAFATSYGLIVAVATVMAGAVFIEDLP